MNSNGHSHDTPKEDARREIAHKGVTIKAMPLKTKSKKWELLDAHKHASLFPINGLGKLEEGEGWFVSK
jgi:hypothetical protein